MFKKIKEYFWKLRQEKMECKFELLSNCHCQYCSHLSKCMNAKETYCKKQAVKDFIFYVIFVLSTGFIFGCIAYYDFVEKMIDNGFTAQQIEHIFWG